MEILLRILELPLDRPEAYIDPGSGSILLQLLIAGILGTLVVLRTSWGRIKSFFRRGSNDDEQEQPPEDE